jgi:hypothetical protein
VAAAFHGDELRRFSASGYQRGADDVSLRQPRGGNLVAMPSRRRRCANKKSATWALKNIAQEKTNKAKATGALFQSSKRQSEYQGYRGATPDRIANSMPILIGAAMIAAAILLSTLITAVGTRFAGMESPNDENLWLIDRLTGNVYKCQAPERGKAACEADVATGSIGERPKR